MRFAISPLSVLFRMRAFGVILALVALVSCSKEHAGVGIETSTGQARMDIVLPPVKAVQWDGATLEENGQEAVPGDSLRWQFLSVEEGLYTLLAEDSSGNPLQQSMGVSSLSAWWEEPQGVFATIPQPLIQPVECGVGEQDAYPALTDYCWYVEDDRFEGSGTSSAVLLARSDDSLVAELDAGPDLGVDVYAKLNASFRPDRKALDLSAFDTLVLDADIPAGSSLEIQLLQADSAVNYHVWYTATVVGKGLGTYKVAFASLVKWKEAIQVEFSSNSIYGISIRNQIPLQQVRVHLSGVRFL